MRTLISSLGFTFALCAVSFSQVRGVSIRSTPNATISAEQRAALSELQTRAGNVVIAWNETNSTPAYLAGRLSLPGYENTFLTPQNAAVDYIAKYRSLFRLMDPTAELLPLKVEKDKLGMTHVRLQQIFQGLKVVGAQLIVHFASDGSVSSINGRYSSTPQIPTTQGISPSQASVRASTVVKDSVASSELIVYLNEGKPVLAHELRLPTPRFPNQRVIIDAQTGVVLDVDDGIRYDGPNVGSGPGVFGTVRSLKIYDWNACFCLIDASKAMYRPPVDNLEGVIETWDAHNFLDFLGRNGYKVMSLVYDPNDDRVFNDNVSLPAAVDAHFFSGEVYDFYKKNFDRNSWNNAGGNIKSVVHFGIWFNNAFWNGAFMTYGDGDGVVYANLAGAFDLIVHEITHGVTEATANLEYRGQSGALNESYSDVMACMADSGNWTIGEDVYTPSIPGDALRDLSNPHQGGTGLSDPSWQPATMGEYCYLPYTAENDYGGVHVNSGIPSHAAYFVASTIGHARTAQIYYRTLAYYLTPKSLFIDARLLSLQAAADLYGSGGPEYAAVAVAFDRVGITSNLPRTNELAYDDGSPSIGVYEADANWGLVNKMTAPSSGTLVSLEFYYAGDNKPNGNGSFIAKVFAMVGDTANDRGEPGANLFTSDILVPSSNPYDPFDPWVNCGNSFPQIPVPQDFFVGLFYDGVNQPQIGADTDANGRAWEWDNTQSKWVNLDQSSYYPVTLFIRAIVNTPTGVHVISSQNPADFSLSQNYPNPFNPFTTIRYGLPQRSHVILSVFNTLGQQIGSLVNREEEAGYHEVRFDGSNLASGIYLYQLRAGSVVYTKKFVLIR